MNEQVQTCATKIGDWPWLYLLASDQDLRMSFLLPSSILASNSECFESMNDMWTFENCMPDRVGKLLVILMCWQQQSVERDRDHTANFTPG